MAAKLGKCINYAGCGIAYRNELVPAQTTAFICPECGKPLKDRSASMRMPPWVGAVGAVLVLLLLAGGWWLFGSRLTSKPKSRAASPAPRLAVATPSPTMPAPTVAASETAAVEMSSTAAPMAPMASSTPGAAVFDPSAEPIVSAVPDARATPAAIARSGTNPAPATATTKKPQTFAERIKAAAQASANTPSPEPPAPPVIAAAKSPELTPIISQDAVAQEREEVRREVLKRIDAMPKLTSANRGKLYEKVEKSKSMNKLFSVSFDLGQSSLRGADEAEIRRQVKSDAFQQLTTDPSTVFVILGYADTQGDPKRNLQLSVSRAQSALDELKDRYAVMNVMHAVGMGGSNLLDASKKEKNRVAEIWAVSP